jgi:hypothetical protein
MRVSASTLAAIFTIREMILDVCVQVVRKQCGTAMAWGGLHESRNRPQVPAVVVENPGDRRRLGIGEPLGPLGAERHRLSFPQVAQQ